MYLYVVFSVFLKGFIGFDKCDARLGIENSNHLVQAGCMFFDGAGSWWNWTLHRMFSGCAHSLQTASRHHLYYGPVVASGSIISKLFFKVQSCQGAIEFISFADSNLMHHLQFDLKIWSDSVLINDHHFYKKERIVFLRKHHSANWARMCGDLHKLSKSRQSRLQAARHLGHISSSQNIESKTCLHAADWSCDHHHHQRTWTVTHRVSCQPARRCRDGWGTFPRAQCAQCWIDLHRESHTHTHTRALIISITVWQIWNDKRDEAKQWR